MPNLPTVPLTKALHIHVAFSFRIWPPLKRRLIITGYPRMMIIKLPMERFNISGVSDLLACSCLRKMITVRALPRKPMERMAIIITAYARCQTLSQLKVYVLCAASVEVDMLPFLHSCGVMMLPLICSSGIWDLWLLYLKERNVSGCSCWWRKVSAKY